MVSTLAEDHRLSEIEVHNLRIVEPGLMGSHKFASHIAFKDIQGREVRITKAEWDSLGQPTYLTANLRTETFAESTP